jgi:hypothetical protein
MGENDAALATTNVNTLSSEKPCAESHSEQNYQISSLNFWLYGQQKFKYEGYGATVALPERWLRMPLALEK